MKVVFILMCGSIPALAQTTIHVTATPQSQADTRLAFGRLKNHIVYGLDICLASGPAAKIPTALLRQSVKLPAGWSLLSSQMALMVIQNGQGSGIIARASSIAGGLAAGASEGLALKKVPSGWATDIVYGIEGASFLTGFLFPALQTHAVSNVPALLPEVLDFTESACAAPAVAIVSVPRKSVAGVLDLDVTVP